MSRSEDFDAFYAARESSLVRSLYLRTGDLTRAQECVQEAFIRAWLKWDSIVGSDPVAWVTTTAWRLAIRDWRRRRIELRAFAFAREPDPAGPPPDEAIALHALLASLPEHERDVIVLHYFADLPIAEISRLLGMPEGTVKSHLSRGRGSLRSLLQEGIER